MEIRKFELNRIKPTIEPSKFIVFDFYQTAIIEYTFYRAKYRDAVGDLPSEAHQEFAEALKEIFQKNK